MPFETARRPTPSGPSASAKNPPITAVGRNNARRCLDDFRISAAARNTSASRTSASPTSSAVHIRTNPLSAETDRSRGACEADVGERLVCVEEPQDQGAEEREEEPFTNRKGVAVADEAAGGVDEAEIDGEEGDELGGGRLERQALVARVGDADRRVGAHDGNGCGSDFGPGGRDAGKDRREDDREEGKQDCLLGQLAPQHLASAQPPCVPGVCVGELVGQRVRRDPPVPVRFGQPGATELPEYEGEAEDDQR